MDETGGKVTLEIVFLYERNQLKNSIQMCLSFLLVSSALTPKRSLQLWAVMSSKSVCDVIISSPQPSSKGYSVTEMVIKGEFLHEIVWWVICN